MTPPTLAVWKLTSCDGCQLTLLDCEDELLAIADTVRITHFTEAGPIAPDGPFDISLIEGSVTTPAEADRVRAIRAKSGVLVAIGACAMSGGIQALRNFADIDDYISIVYASPEHITTLATATPVSAHVAVDHEIAGCPISKAQLLETITALLAGRKPQLPTGSVCGSCKRHGIACVMVAEGTGCLGPVTRDGCGALCPSFHRGCYGCYGPMATPNVPALLPLLRATGMDDGERHRVLRTFHATTFSEETP